VDEDSIVVFCRHVQFGNPLTSIDSLIGNPSPNPTQAVSHLRKRRRHEKARVFLERDNKLMSTSKATEEVSKPKFQGCLLIDFERLIENCVHPRCARDPERLSDKNDKYDESRGMMTKEFFDSFDQNRSQSITRDELLEPLSRVVKALVMNGQLDKESIVRVSSALDEAMKKANNQLKGVKGEISFPEFQSFMAECVRMNKNNLATSRVLFRLLGGGREGKKTIGVRDIRRALHDIMHTNISDDLAEKMLAVADEDGSGSVSIDEFKIAIFEENLQDSNGADDSDENGGDASILATLQKPTHKRSVSWNTFNTVHEHNAVQQLVVETVTHQALVIFGLACLGIYSRLRSRSGDPKDLGAVAKKWEDLLQKWNQWTPKQFTVNQHSHIITQMCIKINVELYRLGHRKHGSHKQIPQDWLRFTMPPHSNDI
jgi:Ca2+-binding EF-hand superfamily protein